MNELQTNTRVLCGYAAIKLPNFELANNPKVPELFNVTGNLLTPATWIFHKGLFTKRKSSLKMPKDLYGIWYVASQLGDFSEHTL